MMNYWKPYENIRKNKLVTHNKQHRALIYKPLKLLAPVLDQYLLLNTQYWSRVMDFLI
jgi:hypothetical protein